ncbi:carbohydrate-binding module family 18 protein [Gonapodya prolifera JEL478]|uniref:Carbohydrate-binding module family 18 protein n=1 Tax=Gonapodya prolifera (strain JEL478) TaxID=1344416 RepID=A0A139AUX7_GONPJ|nr:carbohydrate-binding module family 18 protein [Gonapodya prolifera JEL478]|eukprot:KXS20504.1 carbohydrate-binding module family 18 protein [Gonapodya prolifera JEL478]
MRTALLSSIVALALSVGSSAQTLLQAATAVVPAGKSYNLTTLQSLLSPSVLGNDTFNTLAAALGGGANLTVFAPTDTAFAATIQALGGVQSVTPLVPQILSYHVSTSIVSVDYLKANKVSFIPTLLGNSSLSLIKPQVLGVAVGSDGKVSIEYGLNEAAKVIDTVVTSNGVIHVIDSVLIPPVNASATITAINAANQAPVTFKNLAAALVANDLLTAVDTVTPITIFAPLDVGFEAVAASLNSGQLEAYLKTVLTYHVIGGAAAYFPPSGSYQTLAGENITVVSETTNYTVTINGQPVLDTVLLTNGVVHVIKDVLIPPSIAKVLTPSSDGSCGKDKGTCGAGCCSQYGYCGTSSAYCDSGCQLLYGKQCATPAPSLEGKCGPGVGSCGDGYCCSHFGYCGKSDAYCKAGCQSAFGRCDH